MSCFLKDFFFFFTSSKGKKEHLIIVMGQMCLDEIQTFFKILQRYSRIIICPKVYFLFLERWLLRLIFKLDSLYHWNPVKSPASTCLQWHFWAHLAAAHGCYVEAAVSPFTLCQSDKNIASIHFLPSSFLHPWKGCIRQRSTNQWTALRHKKK